MLANSLTGEPLQRIMEYRGRTYGNVTNFLFRNAELKIREGGVHFENESVCVLQNLRSLMYPNWGTVVVKALRYYSDGPGIDSRWCHWGFFFPWIPTTEPCALGSTQPLEMTTRDFSWGKGGRCVRLTTYHPRSAERQENPGP